MSTGLTKLQRVFPINGMYSNYKMNYFDNFGKIALPMNKVALTTTLPSQCSSYLYDTIVVANANKLCAMPIETIDNRRLYRQIADQMTDLFKASEYQAGERLPAERLLAERFAVSRPTMREALIALEVEGWIEIRGGSGVFVLNHSDAPATISDSTTNDVPTPGPFEVLFARDLIEPDIAALAARNATASHLDTLARSLSNMVCCSANDVRRLEYDREFHFALADASGNSALLLAIQALWRPRVQPVYLRLEDHFQNEQVWLRAIIGHRKILEAVKQGDAKAARSAMRHNLQSARKLLSSNWRED
jgi:DNA-binding FadR family transcriptional regulator